MSDQIHLEEKLFSGGKSQKNLFISFKRCSVNLSPENALFIIHGFGEHQGRYLEFIDEKKTNCQIFCSFDLSGHGKSQGTRGHVENFDDFIKDCDFAYKEFLNYLSKNNLKKIKIHLFAHSLGALIAIRWLSQGADKNFSSVYLSSPFLGFKVNVPKWKKVLSLGLSNLWPNLLWDTKLNPELLSHDEQEQNLYAQDRLVHSKMSSRMFQEIVQTHEQIMSEEEVYSVPIRVLIPLADHLVDPECSLKWTKKNSSLEVFPLPGVRHEAFHEKEEQGRKAAFEDLFSWIQKNA